MATTKGKPRKKPGPRKGEGGRPRLEFNLQQVEALGQIMATNEEVATVLECSVSTVEDRLRTDEDFSRALEKGRAGGKLALRRAQVQAMSRGNVTMMIWLGKQWLQQSDQVSVDATVESRTGVAHVPPEVTLEHWEAQYGKIEVDGDALLGGGEEPN